LEQILPATFLHTLRAEVLMHKPRHLQALALRIERAEHSPLKDSKKAKRLQPRSTVCSSSFILTPLPSLPVLQEEYRELLEEFRVSLFAPELGTSQPVSEQRLEQKWGQIEEICRQVE
jgi:ATP-dependent helicase HrpA